VAKNFLQSSEGVPGQWPDNVLGSEDLVKLLTNELYTGRLRDQVPFSRLKRLVGSFTDGRIETDMPALMAEWLCAVSEPDDHTHLRLSDFTNPPRDEGEKKEFGVRCKYRNAPTRLTGFECAFVRFELEANDNPPSTATGERIDRVTELLRHIHDPKAVENIPRSHLHVHPGDEIVYVAEGTVFVQLENTGIWTPVQEGDFIHFNAEIPHAVWNLGPRPAVAVIIRFFQLKRHSTRQRQNNTLQDLERLMGGLDKADRGASKLLGGLRALDNLSQRIKQAYKLWTEIAPWVHDRTRRPQDRMKTMTADSEVQDVVGLSRFLHSYLRDLPQEEAAGQRGLAKLRDAIKQLEPPPEGAEKKRDWEAELGRVADYNAALQTFVDENFEEADRSKVRSCFEGLPVDKGDPPNTRTLEKIAGLFSALLPRVLLDGYIPPNALRVVVVRGAAAQREQLLNWVEPSGDDRGTGAEHIHYRIPARTLANSDVSVVLLDLSPGGHSSWNRHPGYEALIPIRGSVEVVLDESPAAAHAPGSNPGAVVSSPAAGAIIPLNGRTPDPDSGSIVVYRSSVPHMVRNAGSVDARVLVIRFNTQS
jgi:quercetin dioxygenase-like cupin family protein